MRRIGRRLALTGHHIFGELLLLSVLIMLFITHKLDAIVVIIDVSTRLPIPADGAGL